MAIYNWWWISAFLSGMIFSIHTYTQSFDNDTITIISVSGIILFSNLLMYSIHNYINHILVRKKYLNDLEIQNLRDDKQ